LVIYLNCMMTHGLTNFKVFISVNLTFMISGLRREVDGNCAPLNNCAASSGSNLLPTFRNKISVRYAGVNP
jgi:hypothetical protein